MSFILKGGGGRRCPWQELMMMTVNGLAHDRAMFCRGGFKGMRGDRPHKTQTFQDGSDGLCIPA